MEDATPTLYDFGDGLSYTTFTYSDMMVSPAVIPPDGEAVVSVTVRNAGQVTADEVVQLYLRDEVSSATRPVRELAGFQRLVALPPGETAVVRFPVGPSQLGFYDAKLQWAVEPGAFTIMVGGSQKNTVSANLEVR